MMVHGISGNDDESSSTRVSAHSGACGAYQILELVP